MDTLIGVVPDDWVSLPLKGVCEIRAGLSGTVARNAQRAAGSTGIAVITAKGVRDGTIREDQLGRVDPSSAGHLQRFRVQVMTLD